MLHAYILRTMFYQHESLQAAVGPPDPLPNHHFPRFPLSSIIWSNTSRSQVYVQWFLQHAIFLTTFLEINLAASTSLTKALAPSFG